MVSPRNRVRPFAYLAALLVAFFVVAVGQAQAVVTAASPKLAAPSAGGKVNRGLVATDEGIAAEADHLSGRKLTVVCATTAEEWDRALATVGLPATAAEEYYGFSLIPQGEMHLSPYVCAGLQLGVVASARRLNELQVAWAVDVLVHESVHMARFTYDEALTEACARVGLPAELHRLYGLAYHSPEMARLTFAAASFRSTQGPAYRGGTCPPPL